MRIEDFKTITEKHVETCKKLVENEGVCVNAFCTDCPFDYENASNCKSCITNGYAINDSWVKKNLVVEQSAKAFIKMCEEKKLFAFEDEVSTPSMLANNDKVNSPNHYRMNIKGVQIEVMDIIESILTPEEFRGYKKGNVLKYILREKLKNGLEDLKKCENYLKRLIQGDENAK